MALDGRTWRSHSLKIGELYEARSDFGGPGGAFVQGKQYRLQHIGHSHYDGCSIFTFQEMGSSSPVACWWADEETEAEVSLRFRPSRA